MPIEAKRIGTFRTNRDDPNEKREYAEVKVEAGRTNFTFTEPVDVLRQFWGQLAELLQSEPEPQFRFKIIDLEPSVIRLDVDKQCTYVSLQSLRQLQVQVRRLLDAAEHELKTGDTF